MRHGNMRLSLGARPPRSAGDEGCCGRADAVGKTHAAGGRMPRGRTRIRTAHCSLAAALTVIGLRHRPQSGSYRDRARLPQTYAIMGGGAVGRNARCTCDTRLLLPSVRKALRTLNRGKICATCMIRGVCAAKRAPSWQDIHVVYPPTAICRAFRMHGAHILPKPAHFGCVAAIYCHEGVPFPSEAFFGIHRGKILPSSDTRERITSTYRHRQALGNAFRGHLAVAERPRAHCEHTLLCAGLRGIQFAGICRHARPPDDAPRQHIASKATLRLRKGQHARSHRTPPEPIRGMRRCPAAAVGAAAMKEPGHWRARPTGGRGRDIDARRLPGAREGHRRAPFAGCGDALTCSLLGARGPSAAGSQPAEAWSRLGRGRAAATRTRIRTAAPSAHQTRRSCCRYARRDGAVSFARTVR